MATPSTSTEENRPRHTGLLRDENIFLRLLFGYADFGYADTCEDMPGPSFRSLATNLPKSSIKDVLLISIDIDTFQGYEQITSDQQFHTGVSLFDCRSLQASGAALQADSEPDSVIKSLQFTIGDSRYCRRAANRFLFGQSEPILLSEVKPRLEQIVSGRDVVLVLHGAMCDFKVLEHLGIDLHPIFVIDTVKAAQHPLGLSYRYSLAKLLEALGISFAGLHAAGNDAHFALRALLMIAVKDAERQTNTPFITSLSKTLRSIALAPRPPSAGELAAPYIEARQKENEERRKRRKANRQAKLQRRLERRNQAIDLAGPPNEMAKQGTESASAE
ncbi:hypothetical protein QBC46DRAFT_438388 [Diplogelasinospora grovesii]|uniref:Gfd2/YDR514C-like C-terminal domain-containing protein n=1 Tax=Diplogelasinospora grovesii TaxID=303347 RepID=A0AAN6N4U9_9PEZI|nr:hypothetical protein QBC46DRAFT_438388 [Diplogelasinospora grovesii]